MFFSLLHFLLGQQTINCFNNFYFVIAIVIKPSNIRIWIHDKDIPKLTKVVWEGQGMRLKQEASSHPKVKRLLDSIPYIMVRHFLLLIKKKNRSINK